MITLVQFPWSPFCLVQRRLLEFSGKPFKIVNVPNPDRSLVWKWTRQRYYQVPIIRDGRNIVFETCDTSQVIAKYLDAKLGLDLFPQKWEGIQDVIWQNIENDVEGTAFKLNDIYYREFVPEHDWMGFLRHKERKFGRGCIDGWRQQQVRLINDLAHALVPFEQMLSRRPFLLDTQPRFVDFDLWGMLANFLYSGHYQLFGAHERLQEWHGRMTTLKQVVKK